MGWTQYSIDGTAKTSTVSSSVDLPIGSITTYGGSAAPLGWLICDGAVVSRTAFSELFSVLGTTYGAGDGSTTFGLPDLRGRIPVGKTTGGTFPALGGVGGAETHTLTTPELASHGHSVTAAGAVVNAGQGAVSTNAVSASSTGAFTQSIQVTQSNAGSGTAHNNLQPFQVVHYIIKAQNVQAATAADFQAARAKGTVSSFSLVGTNVLTKIPLSATEYDTDGIVDLVNNRLTVPAGMDGLYLIDAALEFPNNGTGGRHITIRKNGSVAAVTTMESTANASYFSALDASVQLELVAGDYIELWANQNSTVNLSVGSGTFGASFLSMVRLSGAPTPTQTQQPQVRVFTTTTPAPLGAGVAVPLSFDSERYDTDTMHSGGSPTRLTATTSGLYSICGTATLVSNATGWRELSIRHSNGSAIAADLRPAASGVQTEMNISTQYRMSAGDYVELYIAQTSGGSLAVTIAGQYSPEFMMARISA